MQLCGQRGGRCEGPGVGACWAWLESCRKRSHPGTHHDGLSREGLSFYPEARCKPKGPLFGQEKDRVSPTFHWVLAGGRGWTEGGSGVRLRQGEGAVILLSYLGVYGWYWHSRPPGLGAPLPASPADCPGTERRASVAKENGHQWLWERRAGLRCSLAGNIRLWSELTSRVPCP